MVEMNKINEFLRRDQIESDDYIKNFKSLKGALIFSYQEICTHKGNLYSMGELVFLKEEYQSLNNALEKYY